ncbi:MAG: glycosyltransferase [Lachnospiraceae bacterium]|nr:glycosyltransferase [Lachnospiraceae bacterium]
MAEKRKLILISPMLHQGGFERVCVTTARLLEPYFDITIVIFDSADIAYNVDGLKIIDLKLGVQQGKWKKILNIIKRSLALRKLKKQIKPDISYSFGPTANMANAFSKTKGTKVWLGIRSYMDVEETTKMKLFTRFGDLLVCCSKEIQKEIEVKFGFDKTGVLYNPYDVELIRREAEKERPHLPWQDTDEVGRQMKVLVSMGRDDEVKGFWHLLKSFSLVQAVCPESRLLILGDGTFEKDKKLAKNLGIADKVCFAGMQREPYKYLREGQIYVLTSSREGFPNALVEGMALGLAPVSTNCMTGPAEILMYHADCEGLKQQMIEKKTDVIYGDFGILLPVMDAERSEEETAIEPLERTLADVLVKLLEDTALLEQYRQAAAGRAGIFTYEGYVEQFLKMAAE